MPNIPNYKGLVSAGTSAGLSLSGAALINKVFGNYWGVFNEFGVPIMLSDNVMSVQYSNQAKTSDAPLEKGAYTSYNKVQDPSQVTIQMSKGSGGTLARGAFLAQLEILQKSTLKFFVITPEYVYMHMTLINIDYAREASQGLQLIKVNMTFKEIIEKKVKYELTDVKHPQDASTQSIGQQSSQPAPQSILDKIREQGPQAVDKIASWAKGVIS